MATITALALYIGDDWAIAVQAQDSVGAPIDLTGFTMSALFWQGSNPTPLDVSGANGSVTLNDASNGRLTVLVSRVASAGATPQGTSKAFPNRVQVIATDGAAHRRTLGVIPIAPVAP